MSISSSAMGMQCRRSSPKRAFAVGLLTAREHVDVAMAVATYAELVKVKPLSGDAAVAVVGHSHPIIQKPRRASRRILAAGRPPNQVEGPTTARRPPARQEDGVD
jgi:hypothetical protein